MWRREVPPTDKIEIAMRLFVGEVMEWDDRGENVGEAERAMMREVGKLGGVEAVSGLSKGFPTHVALLARTVVAREGASCKGNMVGGTRSW